MSASPPADVLFNQGVEALSRGDLVTAGTRLRAAAAASPGEAVIPLMLAVVHRQLGDLEGEHAAVEAALAIDAYFLPGLLARGDLLERRGRPKAAAEVYRNALKVAPPEPHWPPALQPGLARARQVTNAHGQAFAAHLDAVLTGMEAALPPDTAERWAEAAAIMAGLSRPYTSESNQLHVPRLPAIPFFDRARFPWAAALEARTDAIRGELEAVMRDGADAFTPYIAYRPGDPVNQWRELNHSARWSTFHLWRGGEPVTENLRRCPETARALKSVAMAEIGGLCPNAMFSVLAPHTAIPPHTGETNARLVAHLPLIVPPGCSYRVGYDQRGWTEGELLVFDDTLEHEARNDSDHPRVVLIFDVWNPLLAEGERRMVQALAAAARTFAVEG